MVFTFQEPKSYEKFIIISCHSAESHCHGISIIQASINPSTIYSFLGAALAWPSRSIP